MGRPEVIGKIHHDRDGGAPHHNPAKRIRLRWVDFHVGQECRHVNKVAGLRCCAVFAAATPADLAHTRQDISDRLLLAVMMDTSSRPRFDLEQTAPKRRLNAELWRNRGKTDGTRRLCRAQVEAIGADDSNWGIFGHRESLVAMAL